MEANRVRELVSAGTNTSVLGLTGIHFRGSATTRVTLAGQREVHFPVRGDLRMRGPRLFALMSALDESGESLVEYREIRSRHGSRFEDYSIEALIRPTALTIPHIELLVAISSGFVFGYEKTGGGA